MNCSTHHSSHSRAFLLALFAALWLLPLTAGAAVSSKVYWGCFNNTLYISPDSTIPGVDTTLEEWNLSGDVPWENKKSLDDMLKIKVVAGEGGTLVAPSSISGWFNKLTKTTSIDLSGLDTSNVTDMSYAFSQIQTNNPTFTWGAHFDTSHVTTMAHMFQSSYVKTLDLSCFNTSSVTDMSYMFDSAFSLSSLSGLDGWDTSNVITMSNMFNTTRALNNSSFLEKWDVSKVEDMSSMFRETGVKSIDFSSWKPISCKNFSNFLRSSNCSSIVLGKDFKTPKAENFAGMFCGCQAATLDVSMLDFSNVTSVSTMFGGDSNHGGYNTKLTSITFADYVDARQVTSMNSMFYCGRYKSLDLSTFHTDPSKLKSFSNIFQNCELLETLDISGLRVNSNSSGAFSNLTAIKTITVGDGWNAGAFNGCPKGPWIPESDSSKSYAVNEIPKNKADTYHLFSDIVYWKIVNGMLYLTTQESNLEQATGIPGIKADGQIDTNTEYFGNNDDDFPPWHARSEEIQGGQVGGLAENDVVKPIYMAYWFCGCSNLRQLSLAGLDSSRTKSMKALFSGCSSLIEDEDLDGADLAHLNTTACVQFTSLFQDCSTFTYLDFNDFPNFTVSQAAGYGSVFNSMFSGCTSLRKLDISCLTNFTSSSTQGVFKNCSSLSELSLPDGFMKSNGRTLEMFMGCSSLTKLDLHDYGSTAGSTNGYRKNAFNGCTALEELDISGLFQNTGYLYPQEGGGFLGNCYSLKTIKVGKRWTNTILEAIPNMLWKDENGVVYESTAIPSGAHTYTRVDEYGFWSLDTATGHLVIGSSEEAVLAFGDMHGSVTFTSSNQPDWNSYKSSVRKVTVGGETYGDVAPYFTNSWFQNFTACAEIDLSGLDMSRCYETISMFQNCTALRTIIAPAKAEYTSASLVKASSMFQNCSKLAALDLSWLDTANVTTMASMFQGCSKLAALDVSSFNTAKVTTMASMFYDCKKLAALDVSSFDTTNVTTMASMFYGCAALPALDGVSSFNTAKVTTMASMFSGCAALESMDVHSFSLAKITTTSNMFNGCKNLHELNMRFDEASGVKLPATLNNMLTGCTTLCLLSINAADNNRISHLGLPMPSSAVTPCIVDGVFVDGDKRCTKTDAMQENVAHDWRVIWTVTIDTAGGSPAIDSPQEVQYGDALALATVTRNGYAFAGWLNTEDGTPFASGSAVTTPTTLVAQWTPVSHTITYHLDGGENAPDNPESYTEPEVFEDSITLKPATKTGFYFRGWYDNAEFDGEKVTEIPQNAHEDFELYAKFTQAQYTVKFEANEGTGDAMPDQTWTFGETHTMPECTYAAPQGLALLGWGLTAKQQDADFFENQTNVPDLSETDGDTVTLYAIWADSGNNKYIVRYYEQLLDGTYDNDHYTEQQVKAVIDETVTVHAKKAPDGFQLDLDKCGSPVTLTITADLSKDRVDFFFARKINAYTLNTAKGAMTDGTTLSNDSMRFGTPIKLRAALRNGYEWKDDTAWDCNVPALKSAIAKPVADITMPDSKLDMTPNAKAIDYTITIDLAGGHAPEGTSYPTTYTVEKETFRLAEPVRDYYTFLGWTGSCGTEPQKTVTITQGTTGNLNYTAVWEAKVYPITYLNCLPAELGADTPVNYTKESQFPIKLVTPSRAGYTFVEWRVGSAEGETATQIKNFTETPQVFWAVWSEPVKYTITYELHGGTDASSNPTTYTVEDNITFSTEGITREHYNFLGWFTDYPGGDPMPGIAKGSTGAKTVHAHWAPKVYDITYNLNGGDDPGNPETYTVESMRIVLKNPSREGFSFQGWTGTGIEGMAKTVAIEIGSSGDRTYTAHWDDYFTVHHCPIGGDETTEQVSASEVKAFGSVFDVTMPLTAADGTVVYKGVTAKYLYGGMWTDGRKETLVTDTCGKELSLPEAGSDIYVREVPDCYVEPRAVNYSLGGMYHTLFMAPVDIPEAEQTENVPYQKTVFVFSGEAMQSFEAGQTELFDNVILTTPDTEKIYNSVECLGNDYPGSLACYELPDAKETEWNGSPVTVRAYVVTLDNVKVFATTAKTFTFGSKNKVVSASSSTEERRTEVYSDPLLSYGAERLPMLRMSSFSLGDAADEDIVLTLHTDGLVTKTRGTAGSDLRALAGTPTLAGSLFTGWHLDEACTVPADFSAITADTELYADFVPATGLLELESRPMTVRGRIVRLQLLSACDITAESCGFTVDRGGRPADVPADCYRAVDGTTAQASFGANPETATLFTCDLPAAMLDSAAEIRVTPFWTTPDGCRVCGKTVTVRLDK